MDLVGSIRGDVLQPDSPGFEEACALWNARFDRRPDLIVRCADHEDVATAIRFAISGDMAVSVKGGGHSYAANSVADGGLLIDLSPMNSIQVDPESRTVLVQGGVTCGELDAATQAHGLATPLPTVSSVGVAGGALGGGSGYLSRKYGLTADNVIAADVVTAAGDQVRTSEDEHSDLFWALRGGGGNFGIATSLELRLHQVGPDVLAGQIIYPFDDAGSILRFFREFMSQAPEEFQCYPFMFRVPPIELFPEETHGQPVLDFVLYHEDSEAAEFVGPLRDLGEPILDFVGPTPYVQVQQSFDPNLPKGQRYYSKAHNLAELSDGVIDTVVELVPAMQGELTAAYFEPLGGAVSRVDPAATPYGGRGVAYGFHCLAGWLDEADDESVMAWAKGFHDAMAGHATGGVYVNLIADDESDRVPAAYGENYGRLVDVKRKWDPGNLFSNNYNIPPK